MPSQYNPEIHHRRSIRLKGHDYAVGGLYFITICAHHDAGNIFAPPDVREMVGHEYIAGVKSGKWPRFPGKIWHRNYYECIVRNPEAERKIGEYIRMNPWKCISHFGNGMRGIGNPALLNCPKIGVLCSRKVPPGCNLEPPESEDVFIGGFHSPPEKQSLDRLLARGDRIICCPAWGLKGIHVPEKWLPALDSNRILILEMKNPAGNLVAAAERNMFVMQSADQLWVPHATPGGMLTRLLDAKSRRAR